MRTIIKKISLQWLFLIPLINNRIYPEADLVIFSYDRPLQLYALLESVETYVTGLDQVRIIYRASTDAFEEGYNQVKRDFNSMLFMRQGKNPTPDFKPLTLLATFDSPSNYVLFAVDDIIIKDYIDLERAIKLLEATQAYGVYFRLGLNISRSYNAQSALPLPPLKHVIDDVYQWTFAQGQRDWYYPFTLDMALYRKKDIATYLKKIDYTDPNTLEGKWHSFTPTIKNRQGLCYKVSKMLNVPVNVVTATAHNLNMNAYSTQELLFMFNRGLKFDIAPLYQIKNDSVHMEYNFTFIPRRNNNLR